MRGTTSTRRLSRLMPCTSSPTSKLEQRLSAGRTKTLVSRNVYGTAGLQHYSRAAPVWFDRANRQATRRPRSPVELSHERSWPLGRLGVGWEGGLRKFHQYIMHFVVWPSCEPVWPSGKALGW